MEDGAGPEPPLEQRQSTVVVGMLVRDHHGPWEVHSATAKCASKRRRNGTGVDEQGRRPVAQEDGVSLTDVHDNDRQSRARGYREDHGHDHCAERQTDDRSRGTARSRQAPPDPGRDPCCRQDASADQRVCRHTGPRPAGRRPGKRRRPRERLGGDGCRAGGKCAGPERDQGGQRNARQQPDGDQGGADQGQERSERGPGPEAGRRDRKGSDLRGSANGHHGSGRTQADMHRIVEPGTKQRSHGHYGEHRGHAEPDIDPSDVERSQQSDHRQRATQRGQRCGAAS